MRAKLLTSDIGLRLLLAVSLIGGLSTPASSVVLARQPIDVGLTLGSATKRGTAFVLDLGVVGYPSSEIVDSGPFPTCGTPSQFGINRNELRVTLQLEAPPSPAVLTVGSRVSAVLKPAAPLASTQGQQRFDLALTFRLDNVKVQDLNAVYLLRENRFLAEILVDYALLPSRVIQRVNSGSLPSNGANITNWRDHRYEIMTGPPPPHYQLVKACSWLTGDRHCDRFAECAMSIAQQNVSMRFALEGHNESNPEVRNSEGHISAGYRLLESIPTLRVASPDR